MHERYWVTKIQTPGPSILYSIFYNYKPLTFWDMAEEMPANLIDH